MSVSSIVTLSGDGRIRERVSEVLVDTNETMDPVDADVFFIASGTLSAPRTWAPTGGSVGEEITLMSFELTHTITLNTGSRTLSMKYATGFYSSVTLKKVTGTVWAVKSAFLEP